MDEVPSGRALLRKRFRKVWLAARLWFLFCAGLLGATASLSLPDNSQRAGVELALNDVAPQDILAPYAQSFISEILTEQARQEAANAIPDVYDPPDGQIARQQIEHLRAVLDYIDRTRADPYASPEDKLDDLSAILDLQLDAQTAQALLDLPEGRWQALRLETVSVLEQVMRSEIREDRLDMALREIPALVSISLTTQEAELASQLASAFVVPNSSFNPEATRAAREKARAQIDPRLKSYAEGETIIRRGQVVQSIHLEALQVYDLLKTPEPWRDLAVRGLLVTLLGCTLALYLYRIHSDQLQDTLLLGTMTILFVLSVLAMQLIIPGRTILPYLFPTAMLPMLLATLIGPGLGILSALISGALAGFLAARGLELSLYVIFSGTMAALIIGKAERLSAFFWAGIASSIASVAIVIVFRFPDPATDMLGKASLTAAGMISGLLSASLAFGLLLAISSLLGITTNLQLIELARPDHPLLQLILRKAPGTYQHSLQVANLAEQAARAIGANPILTRVGALYHDAGKALRPQFFIENQVPGQNVHEQLDPKTSASVIVSHVRDGLDLARKYRIPQKVAAFIPEHHGTLETSYQYREALESANGDATKINHADFQYPGSKPKSKDTALLMLADGVEAKARAESPSNNEEIDRLVRWVIQNRLEQGQLEHVDLTFRDLETIRRSFVSTLKGMYHPRIPYPEAGKDERADQPEPPNEREID